MAGRIPCGHYGFIKGELCTEFSCILGQDTKPPLKEEQCESKGQVQDVKGGNTFNEEDRVMKSEDVKDIKPFNSNDVLKREPRLTDEEECSPGQLKSQICNVGHLTSQVPLPNQEPFPESKRSALPRGDYLNDNVDYLELLRRAMKEENSAESCVDDDIVKKESVFEHLDYMSSADQDLKG